MCKLQLRSCAQLRVSPKRGERIRSRGGCRVTKNHGRISVVFCLLVSLVYEELWSSFLVGEELTASVRRVLFLSYHECDSRKGVRRFSFLLNNGAYYKFAELA